MEHQFGPTKIRTALIQLGVILAILYLASFYNYLLFHVLTEIAVVAISLAIFMISWNSRKYAENYFFLIIGIGFFFIGLINLLHALAFKGMGIFPEFGANLATQLWLAGRYMTASSFLIAPLFIKKKISPQLIFYTYFIVFLFLISSIFYWKNFPVAYIEGVGLTKFKIFSEYIISFILIASIIILYYKRKAFDKKVYVFLAISIFLKIIAELFFTMYFVVTDIFNLLGHLINIAATFFLYMVIVDISLMSPYRILFKNLKDNEVALKNSKIILEEEVRRRTQDLSNLNKKIINLNANLENKVKIRTAELNKINEFLKKEIKERKEAQIKSKKYLLALENASEHVVITDYQGKIIYANKAAEKLTGYNREELVGKTPVPWGNYLEKNLPEIGLLRKNVWEIVKSESPEFKGEVINQRKSGEKYITQLSISPVYDETDKIAFFIAIERDITKLKEIEKAKDEFISLASHQLRTPLTSIGLSAELLLRGIFGEIEPRQKKYIKEIHDSTRRMSFLVNTLLNVSRLEMGTLQIRPKKINMIEIIDRIVEDILPQINEKKITLVKNYEEVGLIFFDQNILRIIFENLLTNALRYTPNEGKISIEIKRVNHELIIKIADNGCGIPKDQGDKIFDKSFRADNAKEISPDGIGLGLYMVKSIIDKTNSRIWFESEINKGSTFYVAISDRADRKIINR